MENNNKQEQAQVLTDAEVAELQQLRKEKAERAVAEGPTMKISEKGAISLYIGNRFPVTCYRRDWVKLLSLKDQIQAFIDSNKEALDTVDNRFQTDKQAKKQVKAS